MIEINNYCASCRNGIKGIKILDTGRPIIKWSCDFPFIEEKYCKDNNVRHYHKRTGNPKLKPLDLKIFEDFISKEEMEL